MSHDSDTIEDFDGTISPAPTRESVTATLISWFGDGYRGPVESYVANYDRRFKGDFESLTDDVAWSIHVGKGHDTLDMEATMCCADILSSLGFDPSRFQQTPWLACPDCGESKSGNRSGSVFHFLDR